MKDLLFEQQRTQALAITCVYCGRGPGELCVDRRTRIAIENQPAHFSRIKAGERHALAHSARPAPTPATPQTVANPSRIYGTRGWFPANNSGRCGICWKPYEPGTPVLAIGPHNLRAECCADTAEENA